MRGQYARTDGEAMPKPIKSVVGRTEKHRCRRCNRNLPFDQFAPYRGTTRRVGPMIIQLLHPYCYKCLNQLKGRWAQHPKYTPKLDRFWETALSALKGSAYTRGIPVLVTKDDLLGMYLEQDGRCALSGIEMLVETGEGTRNDIKPSVDRIDSSKGYLLDNVHIVCAIVNIMKNDLSKARFVNLCKLVVQREADRQDELLSKLAG
jgi:hypothetical protein